MATFFDLTKPEHAYLFGFLQTDGHLDKGKGNKGSLTVELQASDVEILEQFQKLLLPNYSSITVRTRDTNFAVGSQSAIWCLCDQAIREELVSLGLPHGNKSDTIGLPRTAFSETDYFRGIIDGDGSLGLTGQGFPFLSLVTKSPCLAQGYFAWVQKLTGKILGTKPNKRDKAYNICVTKEDAQTLAKALYYSDCTCLQRKQVSAQQVISWVRPDGMTKVNWKIKPWTPEENALLFQYTPHEASEILQRTEASIKSRLWRLQRKSPLVS